MTCIKHQYEPELSLISCIWHEELDIVAVCVDAYHVVEEGCMLRTQHHSIYSDRVEPGLSYTFSGFIYIDRRIFDEKSIDTPRSFPHSSSWPKKR